MSIRDKRKNENRLTLKKVIISLILSILLWALITNAWGYTSLLFHAQSGSRINYIYDFISRFVWAAPMIVLLRIYAKDVPTGWKELYTNKPHVKPLIIAVAVLLAYHLGSMFLYHGSLWINPNFYFPRHFLMFVMVAFAEELVYRGWGLNTLSAFVSKRSANFLSAIFFMLVHLPAYFIKLFLNGALPVTITAIAAQCVIALISGFYFGYLFNRGKSMWSPMIVHFLADFLSVMLIG